ncbi:peroxidase family protein [Aeoliella mucimassa]|uniref:Peroxidase n=1 Tax=Aeoliella mucimassa TaxID=2527972 RepID=A0A518ALP7_9BACT|nr:peroxidase family protein [Aeoliella mucimassa]QDU55651.1 peroxidase [Aeoliella mucimassa]
MITRIAAFAVCVLALSSLATAQPYRTFDGSSNNTLNPSWGQAGTAFLRLAPDSYPDGLGEVYTPSPARPNPRLISNTMFAQSGSVDSATGLTSGVWQWGQFLDHDITLAHTNSAEPMMIMAPADDPYGMTMIPTSRSVVASGEGELRQQENSLTSYIDGSNVYGSDAATAQALRAGVGGRMLTSAGDLLPTTDMAQVADVKMDNSGNPATMFVAGDIRANEQPGLTAMHTLFVREHNRIADALAAMPEYDAVADDDLLYLKARTIVGAEMQSITYNEFLPMLMGAYAPEVADYQYDPSVNAGIANEFSTAMFRLGHTMLNENLLLAGEDGEVVGQIGLRDAYFMGASYLQDSPELVDKLLMGLATQTSQEIDTQVVDDVRNFLFANVQGMGLDLAAINIERGREHGLADYNTMRTTYGEIVADLPSFEEIDLTAAESFAELDVDPTVIAQIESLYDDVNNLDPWVLALAENHVEGTNLGALLLAGLADQFTRLRDGDAHFYMGNSYLWTDEVTSIVDFDDLHLMDIVSWNTEMKHSPMDFFQSTRVPEPSTMVLLALGLVGGWLVRRR